MRAVGAFAVEGAAGVFLRRFLCRAGKELEEPAFEFGVEPLEAGLLVGAGEEGAASGLGDPAGGGAMGEVFVAEVRDRGGAGEGALGLEGDAFAGGGKETFGIYGVAVLIGGTDLLPVAAVGEGRGAVFFAEVGIGTSLFFGVFFGEGRFGGEGGVGGFGGAVFVVGDELVMVGGVGL